MKMFKELSRQEQMDKMLEHVNIMLGLVRETSEQKGFVEYIDLDEESIKQFSDWNIKWLGIRPDMEVFIVYGIEGDDKYPLYAVNISGDSVITALDELFRLLGRKF